MILDIIDAGSRPVTAGTAVFTATGPVTAPGGISEILVPSVTARLGDGPPPVSADLMPTDLPGMSQWAWQAAFSGFAAAPAPFTFQAPAGPVSFTAASGTPGVLTWTATSALTVLPAGTGVRLSGVSLPPGVAAGTTYYVVSPSGQTVQLAATPGGSPLALTGSGSGTLAVISYYLTALIPAAAAPPFSALMAAPAGTPAAGQVPAATGSGTAAAWTTMIDVTSLPLSDGAVASAGSAAQAPARDHRHPRGHWSPGDHGLIAWTMDTAGAASNAAYTPAGTLNVCRVHVPAAATVTSILAAVTAGGSSLTAGQCFAGLWKADGTRIGVTADQAAAWAAPGLKTMTILGGPFALTPGDYYIGFYANGSGLPSFACGNSQVSGAFLNAGISSGYRFATAGTGLTTAPPSALGTLTASASAWWLALS